MSQHLIDNVAIAWDELGTDLLDSAPDTLRTALTGGKDWPSRELDNIITSDGSPPERELITERNSGALTWGYVLHPHGIEVISLYTADRGPVLGWNTDPCTRFSDNQHLWAPGRPIPATLPPRAAPAQPAAAPVTTRSVTRR